MKQRSFSRAAIRIVFIGAVAFSLTGCVTPASLGASAIATLISERIELDRLLGLAEKEGALLDAKEGAGEGAPKAPTALERALAHVGKAPAAARPGEDPAVAVAVNAAAHEAASEISLTYAPGAIEPSPEHLSALNADLAGGAPPLGSVTVIVAGPAGEARDIGASVRAVRRAQALAPFVAAMTGEATIRFNPLLPPHRVVISTRPAAPSPQLSGV